MIHKRLFNTLGAATVALILVASFFSDISAQQVRTVTRTMSTDVQMLMLQELGAIIVQSGDTLIVDMVMPPEQRPAEYKDVDLQEGDIIKMVNGKKVSSIDQLGELYNSLEAGESLKIGLQRGKLMRMTSFAKGDAEKMPARMMVMTNTVGDDTNTGAPAEIVSALLCFGIMAKVENGHIIVADMIEEMGVPFEGPSMTDGDVIVALNGTILDSSGKVDEALAGVKIGEKVKFTAMRNDEEIVTTYAKPDPADAPKMQRQVIKQGGK